MNKKQTAAEFARTLVGEQKSVPELLREIEELRSELEYFYGKSIYPFSEYTQPCRKCRQLASARLMQETEEDDLVEVLVCEGPTKTFEPAVKRRWWFPWKPATPERLRCECAICKAVYFERLPDPAKDVKIRRVKKRVT